MCRVLYAVLLCALLGSARGARLEEGSQELSVAGYFLLKRGWCLSDPVEPKCEANTIISIKTAFVNRNKRVAGARCGDWTGGKVGCKPNVTDELIRLCTGRRACEVPKHEMPDCAEGKFYQVKINYECIAGAPETALLDSQLHAEEEEAEEEEEDDPLPQRKEDPEQGKEEGEPDSPHKKQDDEQPDIPQPKKEEKEQPQVPKPKEEFDIENPLHMKNSWYWQFHRHWFVHSYANAAKEMDYNRKTVDDIVNSPGTEEVSFQPCYRYKRWWKLLQLSPWARLTCCKERESCYKVLFPDGEIYVDDTQEPTPEEMLKGKLFEGEDSWWVSWTSGIGLQRNDINTWGVCLPNNHGLSLAMHLWETLKAHQQKKSR